MNRRLLRCSAGVLGGLLVVAALGTPALEAQDAKTDEKAQLILETWLPPLGLHVPGDKLESPALGKTDLRLYSDASKVKSPVREQLRKTQILLWATSPAPAPKALQADVQKERVNLKVPASTWFARIAVPRKPFEEKNLKAQMPFISTNLARAVNHLEEAVEALQELQEDRDLEWPRQRAQMDLMQAALLARLAHLEDYGLALGEFRKEQPALKEKDTAWVLVRQDRVKDSQGKRHVKAAKALWGRLQKEHPNSVWATLAKESEEAKLGVEWSSGM